MLRLIVLWRAAVYSRWQSSCAWQILYQQVHLGLSVALHDYNPLQAFRGLIFGCWDVK